MKSGNIGNQLSLHACFTDEINLHLVYIKIINLLMKLVIAVVEKI